MRQLLAVIPNLSLVCLSVIASVAHAQVGGVELEGKFHGPFEVRLVESVMVPMRDGTRLSTDLYFPIGAADKLPTILFRDPYNKNRGRETSGESVRSTEDTYFYASHGFVVAKQDSRGKHESEGIYSPPHGNEATDGYDTVEWIVKQSWSNSKVGTGGCSYPGETQMLQAPLMNPHLTAMIPQAAGGLIGAASGKYNYWAGFRGGVLDHRAGMTWYASAGIKYSLKPPAGLSDDEVRGIRKFYNPDASYLPEMDWNELIWHLPLVDVMNEAGAPPNDWHKLVTTEFGDDWWHDEMGFYDGSENFDVPALHISSFYDLSVDDTAFAFNYFRDRSISQRSADNQFLILAPSEHCAWTEATEATVVGELSMGDSRKDWNKLYLDWYAHWLMGRENGITDMPKVQYYVMGANEWRSSDVWPLADIRYTKYFLHSGGDANSRDGDGQLYTRAPESNGSDSFIYDPSDPVPSVGGARWLGGARDQATVESRDDVLVYTTPPLDEGVEVTGPISLVLYISSSVKDTDITAKLVDVHPDGRAYNIQDGILRLRYRDGFTQKVWMQEGEIYEVSIDMSITSQYFAKGHRVRLQVSSSNFPNYERNLNTGGNNYDETSWVVAENTIYHSPENPSHLLLPVIPTAE